ncbi:hypothetical protein BCON_0122g00260 [Botryotinia convoluta]|uniref:Uncharacterized protein n=1 Tax=Botryotinia convoluta TaxID=54673 RepID=A0A4Z1HW79_9HELO|nr:hypothetical protein BCON_0122g00260 [Botryotinia convoluta]
MEPSLIVFKSVVTTNSSLNKYTYLPTLREPQPAGHLQTNITLWSASPTWIEHTYYIMATIDSVNDAISATDLSPTEHLLLKHFIKEAVEPKLAAQFIKSIIDRDSNNVEDNLRRVKKDWRNLASRLTVVEPISKPLDALVRERDGPYCTMSMFPENNTRPVSTPVESAHVITPSFLRDFESAEEGRLLRILETFISTPNVDRLNTLLSGQIQDNAIPLCNLWLLSQSVYKAFRAGHIEVRKSVDDPEDVDSGALQLETYKLAYKYPEPLKNLFLEMDFTFLDL